MIEIQIVIRAFYGVVKFIPTRVYNVLYEVQQQCKQCQTLAPQIQGLNKVFPLIFSTLDTRVDTR